MVRAGSGSRHTLMSAAHVVHPIPASRALTSVASAGMFVFGIVMALLGAVMPALSERLTFTLTDAGTLFLIMNFAMLMTSLVLGLAMDRFGMKLPLATGPWLVALALWIIASASHYTDLLPAVACLGIGGGALNGGTNTLVADLHDDPRQKASALNLLGVFFGFGALFLPFTLGALMSQFGTRGLLLITAGLCAATGVFAAALRFPAPKQMHGLPLAQMPRFFGMPVVLAMAFLLFFQSGNEFVLGGYFATFLTRELKVPIETASYFLAGYWGAIMVARVVLSRLLLRFNAHSVVLGSALLSAAGALVVWAAPCPAAAVTGIIIT
ncbi:MAG: MFS transporter, partial [Bryobacteraceae bacterium]